MKRNLNISVSQLKLLIILVFSYIILFHLIPEIQEINALTLKTFENTFRLFFAYNRTYILSAFNVYLLASLFKTKSLKSFKEMGLLWALTWGFIVFVVLSFVLSSTGINPNWIYALYFSQVLLYGYLMEKR